MSIENLIHTRDYRKQVSWHINEICNFHCNYCGIWQRDQHPLKPIDAIKLSESINLLNGDWHFNISGGEPFLEKNFVDICKAITNKQYLSLITNLSTKNVFDFADAINPDKCLNINASVHIVEREKSDLKLRMFIEKMLYLQNKGFNIAAVYVAHPELFDRIKSDIAYLKSSGIKNVNILIFRGWYNGKEYPSSFNAEQKDFLKSMTPSYYETETLEKSPNHHGHLCLTGQRSFVMDRNGNFTRCLSCHKSYGNLFEKSVRIDFKVKPCPKINCICPFEGIENGLNTKENFIPVLKEDIIELSWMLNKMGSVYCFWQLIGTLERAGIPFSKIKRIFKNTK